MPETTTVLPEGTRVRVTTTSESGDASLDGQAAAAGREYDVYSHATGDEGDDPNGRAYYRFDHEHSIGGVCWAYPEHVEVVMTVEQKAARKLPTQAELRSGVARALISMTEAVEVSETEHEGEHQVAVLGETRDGLRVEFTVTVSAATEVDW